MTGKPKPIRRALNDLLAEVRHLHDKVTDIHAVVTRSDQSSAGDTEVPAPAPALQTRRIQKDE